MAMVIKVESGELGVLVAKSASGPMK
jgi:hypothetical protein